MLLGERDHLEVQRFGVVITLEFPIDARGPGLGDQRAALMMAQDLPVPLQ